MMRKIIILIGVTVVLILVGKWGYNVYNKVDSIEKEKEWYLSQLKYDFSSTLDTVVFVKGNAGKGKLYCRVGKGAFNYSIEDSLASHLKHFDKLCFNDMKEPGFVCITISESERYKKGDSITVNSIVDEVKIFREGVEIYSDKVSNTLDATVTAKFY